jgi:hypothetical protein
MIQVLEGHGMQVLEALLEEVPFRGQEEQTGQPTNPAY